MTKPTTDLITLAHDFLGQPSRPAMLNFESLINLLEKKHPELEEDDITLLAFNIVAIANRRKPA